MKCCDIHVGMFRQRVALQRLTTSNDGYGGTTKTWTSDPATLVACDLKPLSGTESWRAMRVAPSATYRLYTHFRADGNGNPYYTPADRVLFQGRVFNILSVFDVEMEGKWLEMLLNEGALS